MNNNKKNYGYIFTGISILLFLFGAKVCNLIGQEVVVEAKHGLKSNARSFANQCESIMQKEISKLIKLSEQMENSILVENSTNIIKNTKEIIGPLKFFVDFEDNLYLDITLVGSNGEIVLSVNNKILSGDIRDNFGILQPGIIKISSATQCFQTNDRIFHVAIPFQVGNEIDLFLIARVNGYKLFKTIFTDIYDDHCRTHIWPASANVFEIYGDENLYNRVDKDIREYFAYKDVFALSGRDKRQKYYFAVNELNFNGNYKMPVKNESWYLLVSSSENELNQGAQKFKSTFIYFAIGFVLVMIGFIIYIKFKHDLQKLEIRHD